MIFMLFSIMWGRIQEQTTNFERLVHETWPRTCGRVVFKFYKKQTKSENHETCQDVMISYVEAVIKIWEGFAQVVMYNACKPKNLRRSSTLSLQCWRKWIEPQPFPRATRKRKCIDPKTLNHEEWCHIMLYVLTNLDEVAPYMQ